VLNRRLTSAFIIALVVSGIFTFWLSQKFSKNKAAPPPQKSQYVAASANMEAGQAIKAENLRLVEWPASVPLPGAFTTPQALVGRIVMYPLAAGEPILERQLASPGSGAGLSVKIPDGMRAISLRSDEIVGVAGFLLPGTHVDVLVTMHPSNSPDPITATILQDVEILATGQKTEPDPEGKPTTATVVTLLVKPEDAERVDLASTQGVVHFVLRNGVDNKQLTESPALFSQLSQDGAPAPKPVHTESVRRQPLYIAAKPYSVETFLGTTVKTDNFQ
jgi:pilus assembly protein CpaB